MVFKQKLISIFENAVLKNWRIPYLRSSNTQLLLVKEKPPPSRSVGWVVPLFDFLGLPPPLPMKGPPPPPPHLCPRSKRPFRSFLLFGVICSSSP